MKITFDQNKTPQGPYDIAVLEECSQLRAGDPHKYTSKTVIGLLLQYFVVGLLLGSISSLNGPLSSYFHLSPSQAKLTKSFTTIIWSCKVGFGILTDCFPILGYRRKAWMLLGWISCLVSLLVLAFKDHGEPYLNNPALLKKANLTQTEREQIARPNLDAPSQGVIVAAICGVTTVFYVMSVVAADALMVELAQREPESIRGRLVAYVYSIRNIGAAIVQIMIGSLLHTPAYGGQYSWGLSLSNFFLLLTIPVVLIIPTIWAFISETTRSTINCPQYLNEFWHIIQNRPFWQTMIFAFFFNLFTSVVLMTATPVVKYEWAGVGYQTNRWMTALAACTYCIGLWFMSHVVNNCNWRLIVASALVIASTLGVLVDFFTIYNVVRNEWFTLIQGVLRSIPDAVSALCPCVIYIELAQAGKEGITYGMLTTMANVAYVFTPFLGTAFTSLFTMSDEVARKYDSDEKRFLVAMPLLIGYLFSFAALGLVFLLPKQKDHIQFMKAYGGKQPLFAALTLLVCFVSFVATIVTSILSVFPSTMCLALGGGTDC